MPNNYGIIICDKDRHPNAGSIGRGLITETTKTWQRQTFARDGSITTDSVKSGAPCDGNFTGHFLIMVHGNYNEQNNKGHLYAEEPKGKYTEITKNIIDYVNSVPLPTGATKKVYIFACGQGRTEVLNWYRGQNGFNTQEVWCPCTTAAIGGAIDKNDVKSKFTI